VLKGQTLLAGPSSATENQGLRHIYFTAKVDYQFSSRAGDLYHTLNKMAFLDDMVPHELRTFANHLREEERKFGGHHNMWVTVLMGTKECNIELKWCLEQSPDIKTELPKSSLKWPKLSPASARAILPYLP
jgi:hypothetical protein